MSSSSTQGRYRNTVGRNATSARSTAAGRMFLHELRAAVVATGEAVAEQRRGQVDDRTLVCARREHLSAMTAYEQALRAMRLPVPPQLRDDLRLQRRVVAMSDPSPALYSPRKSL